MKELNESLIEKYFLGELSGKKKLQFEEKIIADDTLREELEFLQKVARAIHYGEQKRLKRILQEEEKKFHPPLKFSWWRKGWWLAAAAVLAAGWIAVDFLIENKPLNPQEAFAQHFQAHDLSHDLFLEQAMIYHHPTRDGGDVPPPETSAFAVAMKNFMQAYTAKNYAIALRHLENTPTTDATQHACVQFYQGICQMELGQFAAAEGHLQSALSAEAYQSPALWYLALLHLVNGNTKAAKDYLQSYLASPGGIPHRQAAQKILAALE